MLYEKKISFFLSRGLNRNDAEKQAGEIVAMPGCSEHQLGLAIDVTISARKDLEDPLTEDFGDTPEGIWLNKTGPKYGFILRYPIDKREITQITYEPWHYRYVGIKDAMVIQFAGMCLEEYIHSISY
jgi:D-alanyl-D-alanine carboxypeptidase